MFFVKILPAALFVFILHLYALHGTLLYSTAMFKVLLTPCFSVAILTGPLLHTVHTVYRVVQYRSFWRLRDILYCTVHTAIHTLRYSYKYSTVHNVLSSTAFYKLLYVRVGLYTTVGQPNETKDPEKNV